MGENKNSVFLNLNGCAKNIYNLTDIVANDNALPVTLEAIAQLEEHPPTEQLNGINLKLIYRYLANLMAGYPVEDLKNDSSKRFLESCFKVNINKFSFTLLILINIILICFNL